MKEQGLFHDEASPEPVYTDTLELDLHGVEPSLAGPRRPQDRVRLSEVKSSFARELGTMLAAGKGRPRMARTWGQAGGSEAAVAAVSAELTANGVATELHGESFSIDHGAVVIAAITSCTNTSNPSVMVAAGLLAKKAVERGLATRPWVKTSLAPGSKVVTDYLNEAGLTPYLDRLGFNLVGYGCTTCIGNSGPLPAEISAAIAEGDLVAAAVLSGNRNFEGRINSDVRANYLASPPLVVAYALAGSMDIDLTSEPLGTGADGRPVYLRDVWPSRARDRGDHRPGAPPRACSSASTPTSSPATSAGTACGVPAGDTYAWDEASTYVKQPPYFAGMPAEPAPATDIRGARVLARLRRQHHHRPHLPRRLDQGGVAGRQVPPRARRRGARLQLLRLAARQPRGDDARHLRQHPHQEPHGAGDRGRLHPPPAERRAARHLRRGDALRSRGGSADRPRRQGVRHRLVARLGGQGPAPPRRPRRHRRELRAHPPQQPRRHGRRCRSSSSAAPASRASASPAARSTTSTASRRRSRAASRTAAR